MAVADYNTNPDLNVTISGLNIAEGCTPAVLNNAIRQMMADTKGLQGEIPNISALAPKDSAIFEGTPPIQSGRGGFLHHNDAANASGKISILAEGSANPTTPANGDIAFFYTP